MTEPDAAEKFHPGEFIAEEMQARGWSIQTLATLSFLKQETLEELIAGHRKVTPVCALGLGKAFGTGMKVWLNLQSSYDRQTKDAPISQGPVTMTEPLTTEPTVEDQVCRNCGCPPPRKGEIGVYCSACGAESVYIHKGAFMVTILNTSIITAYGSYDYTPIDLAQAQQIVVQGPAYQSAVGHQATADILTELLGLPITVNRINFEQQVGERAIVFKLRGRAPEGVILNCEQVEAMGYDFGLLIRRR